MEYGEYRDMIEIMRGYEGQTTATSLRRGGRRLAGCPHDSFSELWFYLA